MPLLATLKKTIRMLRKERFFLIATVTSSVIFVCSVAIFIFEKGKDSSTISSLWDGIWWAFVTISTVGYGDKFPTSVAGKFIALALMLSGVVLLSLVTATIASVFVEQKIREGKGLETVKERDHFVLCGWNQHTEEVLRWLNTYGHDDNPSIVLINELSVDEIDALKLKYDSYNLRFLRGNYVHEEVLLRANVTKAKSAVIMADFSGISDKDRADERTILSALTIKSLAPKLKIVAELLSGENKPHLKRANVDEIIVRGEHLGSLLASAVSYPGLPRVLSDLLSVEDRNKLIREKVPAHLIGKTFGELSDFLRKTKSAITIGMLKEKNLMKLEDMLSDDSSVIDRFIKEKIRESKKQFLYEDEQVKVIINPDDTMVLGENDYAVMLARQT